MKSLQTFLFVFSCTVTMLSCRKDDISGNADNIAGLGGDTWVKGPIDEWILSNLTVPYNVAVKYKWDQSEMEFNKIIVPPDEEKVLPVLSAVKQVWIDNYVAETNELFMKKYCPKFFVLAGSASWNMDGTITLGQAEGGRKILLYQLNDFRVKGMDGYQPSDSFTVKQMFHTIEHEFAHILHQNVMYPQEFKQVSVGNYTSNWNNVSDEAANELGFISAYAMSFPDEDFVEMTSMMLVEGRNWFNAMVNGLADEEAQTKLRQKEAIVVNYFKDVWNINFYSLQTRTRASITALVK
ncbi:zinc-binding metallopeptidase [Agriterribacter humi]|uniref:zinc-binding metallopeptidase n=1 Tax=Agriterribacter humi TaxID=1104781 RepID=UPI0012658A58|nr:putative zinc-binding metallopeptidase [Agriterribacter humi]